MPNITPQQLTDIDALSRHRAGTCDPVWCQECLAEHEDGECGEGCHHCLIERDREREERDGD